MSTNSVLIFANISCTSQNRLRPSDASYVTWKKHPEIIIAFLMTLDNYFFRHKSHLYCMSEILALLIPLYIFSADALDIFWNDSGIDSRKKKRLRSFSAKRICNSWSLECWIWSVHLIQLKQELTQIVTGQRQRGKGREWMAGEDSKVILYLLSYNRI